MRLSFKPSQPPMLDPADPAEPADSRDQPIGELLRSARRLTDAQLDHIADYQRKSGLRFGEAAIALDLASDDDVRWALSQQFEAYAPSRLPDEIRHPELVMASAPNSPLADVFRDLCSQIALDSAPVSRPRQALCIVSPQRGDGRSFIAANLAIALSQVGARTLLVDGDLRRPRQHLLFGLENARGLSSLLAGRTGADCIRPLHDLQRLFVLPAGPKPPNPYELLQRPACAPLMRELRERFDYVVIDTPPADAGPDARVIASRAGAAIAVGRQGATRLGTMERMIASLNASRTRVAGMVMNEH